MFWWIVFVVWLTDERRLALFPAGKLSEILTTANLRHRVWTCAESEFRLIGMKFCGSDNYGTTVFFNPSISKQIPLIFISVDNSGVAGAKQKRRLTSDNHGGLSFNFGRRSFVYASVSKPLGMFRFWSPNSTGDFPGFPGNHIQNFFFFEINSRFPKTFFWNYLTVSFLSVCFEFTGLKFSQVWLVEQMLIFLFLILICFCFRS